MPVDAKGLLTGKLGGAISVGKVSSLLSIVAPCLCYFERLRSPFAFDDFGKPFYFAKLQ